MSHGPHDPVQRLNDHHADDLLAIARAFGGVPDTTSARAEHVEPAGIDLLVGTPRGPATAHVDFAVPVDPDRLRMAFRALAEKARTVLADTNSESSTP